MDEVERCHRLAILDSAALVADGVPAETAARLDGHALRLQCQRQRQALLADMPGVLSVAKAGAHCDCG